MTADSNARSSSAEHAVRRRFAPAAARVVATLALVIAAGLVAWSGPAAAARPRCFGAPSRNQRHACHNPKLKYLVSPTPTDALIQPNVTCQPIPAPVSACTFGPPAATAVNHMALVGDSHAAHWRAALGVVASKLNWSGFALTHGSCPFTQGIVAAPEPKRTECTDYYKGALSFFQMHPEVSTMVISDHPGPVIRQPGQSLVDAWVQGITGAWAALPPTVKHIIVLRDVPFIDEGTLPCVDRAIAKHRDAGVSCAVPRSRAIHHDPDVVAAQRLKSPRVQTIDMNDFICSAHKCYPVVGGALVFFDFFDHMTKAFSMSLGPFLADRFRGLTALW